MAYDLPGRLRLLRARLRPDPNDPPRRFLKRRWPWFTALAVAILAVGTLDAWLLTCGFRGCPSPSEIRNFRPAEGDWGDPGASVLGMHLTFSGEQIPDLDELLKAAIGGNLAAPLAATVSCRCR